MARAASDTWTGATDVLWSNTANWNPSVAVPGTGDTATFNAASSNTTIDLGAGVTLGTLLFDTSSAATYTIGSGAVGSQTLTLGTLAGGVQMNSTVAQNQLINTNLALSTTGTYTVGLTNNSTTNTLTVAGGISASTAGAKTLTVSGSGNTTISGAITSGTGTVGLSKSGSGTLTLSNAGTSTIASNFQMSGGLVQITAGTINVTENSGNNTGLRGGANLTVSGGTLNFSGGSSWFPIGDTNGQTSTLTVSGGTVNVANNFGTEVGRLGGGVLTITSGTFKNADTGSGNGSGLILGDQSTGSGTVNLNGGTLIVNRIAQNLGTGNKFYFNGGTLQPTGARTTDFFAASANIATEVRNGGGTIDTAGFNVTIADNIVHSTVGGDNAIDGGLAKVGSGTLTLSGTNTYTGGTTITAGTLTLGNASDTLSDTGAVNVNGGTLSVGGNSDTVGAVTLTSGNITGTTGTLTGSSYDVRSGTVSAQLGGSAALTKTTAGTVTLSGVNTYTGATTVNSGTLQVSGSGGINGSSGVTINGSTAKFVQTSSTAVTVPITLTQGTLDGTGAVGAVTVGNGTGGIVTNGGGGGGTSTLTMDSLTFSGAGTISLNKVNDTSTVGLAVTGAFTTTAANGQITLNVLTSPAWTNGSTYNLISYGSFNGANTDFTVGTVTGLGVRQSATLGNTGASNGFITLAINGDTPVWTGAANGNWTTTAQPSPFNWKLQTAGTSTQFLTNDQVLFNDTATGTTAINIADASVSPASVVFNNSSKNYSVSSSSGFGIASGTLSKSGTGSLTLNTANTYSGGTTLNAGTLNINNASAIGTGALTIAAGTTIDNTSGPANTSPITLSTNNTQFWNGDFTFGGSNDLNLGTGAVTLASSVFITTNGTAALTVGGVIGGPAGAGLFKEGTGTLVLNGANTFDGGVTIDAGTVRIGNASALGTSADPLTFGPSSNGKLQINGNALVLSTINGDNTTTIENSNTTNGSLSVGSGSFDGILQNGSAGTLALTKTGAGTLALTGANTYSGGTTLNGGTLSVSGNSALGTGTVTMAGGTTISASADATLPNAITLNGVATFTAAGGAMVLNGNITGSSTAWTLNPTNKITLAGTNSLTSSGGLITTAGSVDITGSTTIDGGANNNSGFATIGNQAASTVSILSGGSLTIKGTTGSKPGTIVGQNANSNGILNVGATDKSSSGTLNIGGNTAFTLGNNNATAAGILNVNSGTATITAGSTALQNPLNYIALGRDDGTGIINLNGGTLATGRQFIRDGGTAGTQGSGTAIFNFNGGVLQAQANQTQGNGWFETATTGNFQVVTTNVAEGGAKIDTNGFSVNINTALVHAGSNATDGGLIKNGAGILSLGGTNTFTGNAVVNAGTLSLATNLSLDDTIVLSLASGTTLDLAFASGSETVFGLVLNGTSVADGTYDVTQLNALGAGSSISFTSAGGTLTVLSAVPEPGTVALVSLGLLFGLFAFRRSKAPTIS